MFKFLFGCLLASLSIGFWGTLTMKNGRGELGLGPDLREEARQLLQDGNYLESLDASLRLLRAADGTNDLLAEDWTRASQCLANLQRNHELDGLLEEFAAQHADRWQVVFAVAQTLLSTEHYGFVVAGEFQRGQARGGGTWSDSTERDRTRALQLLEQVLPQVPEGKDNVQAAVFCELMASAIGLGRAYGNEWRLQELTDLSRLPDIEPNNGYGWGGGRGWGHSQRGAPVDADGNPVFYTVPESWKSSLNDGQRWRWALDQASKRHSSRVFQHQWAYIDFLHRQFGVQTLAEYGINLAGDGGEDDGNSIKDDPAANPLALRTLTDQETIAKLATGIRRIRMPDEHNPVLLAQRIAEETNPGSASVALEYLAGVYADRQQFTRAAVEWQKLIQRFGVDDHRKHRLSQIVDPWGKLEPSLVSPAGRGAELQFRFRNARTVRFTARKIDQSALIADTIRYLSSNPRELDWARFQLNSFSLELIESDRKKYLGEEVAAWSSAVEPRPGHFDRRTTIQTPLQDAGAYLVTASVDGGNTTHIVVWIDSLAILRKNVDNRVLYYLGEADGGSPVAGAEIDFFGWNNRWNERLKRSEVVTRRFADKTDGSGILLADPDRLSNEYQWLVVARTRDGKMAWMGFAGSWTSAWSGETPERSLAYPITDRPVYRPGQTVKYRIWLREATYREDRKLKNYAGKKFSVVIADPQGKEIRNETVTTDEAGSISGELQLDGRAALGAYTLSLTHPPSWDIHGSVSFRVEEYKKPEFEVKVDVPDAPVKLGETVTAKIRAEYYFGGPVANARVHYKVTRTASDARWFPSRGWDWLYGNGYWWFAADAVWYRGFERWGCFCPIPPWWGGYSDPPELVLDEEVAIGADGTAEIRIDTQLAKALHGDQDHQYSITAEVVDASRRTIVGSGSVTVARQPFRVYAWADRGFTRVGDSFTASFAARTPGGGGVAGTATVRLLKIEWNDANEPVETEVQVWKDLAVPADGQFTQQMQASQAGQFRIACVVDDGSGNRIEGAQLFTITGDGFDGRDFRFNDLEITLDKAEYKPGEKVRLLISANRPDSTVLLWIRPANGVYAGRPLILQMRGKSMVHELEVTRNDMPNFFVEASTISGAKVFEVIRNVVVPPVDKSVTVTVEPSSPEYKPGAEARLAIRVTDETGEPVVGDLVLTMYDRAVEYVSGGSNVGDIREYFWKWTRSHHPASEHSLSRVFAEFAATGKSTMEFLGAFGHLTADQETDDPTATGVLGDAGGFGGGAARRGADARQMLPAEGAPAAPMSAMSGRMDANLAMEKENGDAAGTAMAPAAVRSNFADSAVWRAAITTAADGRAELSLTMPENLTAWKIRSWCMGPATSVGEATVEVTTKKNILVRLQAPRFFVERDEIVLSAIVHNYLAEAKSARVSLDLAGETLTAIDGGIRTVDIPAGGDVRVDWRVSAKSEGIAGITMTAETDVESDAMKMDFPVYVHGMLKTDSFSRVVRGNEQSATIDLTVPADRRPDQTRLEIRYSPTLAGAMVDALPYLVGYPWGCTEQTLNRFVPTAVTLNILRRMNLDLGEIREKRTNLNAQQLGDPAERAAQWKQFPHNPVFDPAEVEDMVRQGISDLTAMQCADGGWGWFSGAGERSSPHTTAVVVHGLQTAIAADMAIPAGVLDGGIQWLTAWQNGQIALLDEWERIRDLPPDRRTGNERYKTAADNLDALVQMVLADAGQPAGRMTDYLYRDRTKLTLYGLGVLGLALDRIGDRDRRDMVLRNMDQFVVYDAENQTAFIDLPNNGGYWWYWYGDVIEANAWYLKLMSRAKPEDPRTAGVVKYLLNNRRHGTWWKGTRDTAICIEAMAEYLVASGENRPQMTIEVVIDGKVAKTVEVTPQNLFSFDNSLVLTGDELESGPHRIELKRTGKGPLYANAYLTNFTLEDHITAAGLEVKVNRKIYRLVPRKDSLQTVAGDRGQIVEQKVGKYDRVELTNLGELTSGELVEVELEIDSKNDYEYVIFEDMNAAGFEPVDLQSGYTAGGLGAYVEFRDERVAFFMQNLARGKHSLSYRLRAEVPGTFSALPARAWAMYAPELRGNSDGIRLKIADEKPE